MLDTMDLRVQNFTNQIHLMQLGIHFMKLGISFTQLGIPFHATLYSFHSTKNFFLKFSLSGPYFCYYRKPEV